jgi:hypothetical protein
MRHLLLAPRWLHPKKPAVTKEMDFIQVAAKVRMGGMTEQIAVPSTMTQLVKRQWHFHITVNEPNYRHFCVAGARKF